MEELMKAMGVDKVKNFSKGGKKIWHYLGIVFIL
jgi:hypothetical protein